MCEIIERGNSDQLDVDFLLYTHPRRLTFVGSAAQTNPDDEDEAKKYSYYVHYLDVSHALVNDAHVFMLAS